MSKILVTGGTGYIGSHTAVELIEAGYEVIIIDNLSNSNIDVLNGIEQITHVRPHFENIDCCDYVGLQKLFDKYDDIDAVIHFAASKAVGESVRIPLAYYRNNILSLLNLLDIMQKHDVNHFVFSSSCTVYGQPDPEYLPVTEKAPIKKALSPYGNTKQVNEAIIQDQAVANQHLNSIILRYFNPIGAHPTALIGELPNGEPQNLMPIVTQTAIGLRKEIKVFGTDYNTPDGSCIRDYIYVVDLAKAHVAAVDRLLKQQTENNVEIFNLGTGKGLSVLEILNMFEKATGVKVNYSISGRREGDIEQVWADPTLANQKLHWQANTPTEVVLKSAWDWEKKVRGK